jgi:mono/diheme cytochrome c family protein
MKYFITLILCLLPTVCLAGDYVIRQKRVEFDSDYYLGVNGYYQVPRVIKEQKDNELQYKILEVLEKINAKLEENSVEVPTEPVKPSTPTEPETPDIEEVSNLDSQVYKIFKENCASCHIGDKAPKGIKLIGEENGQKFLYDLPLADRFMVWFTTRGVNLDKTGHKRMPVGGSALSDEDVNTLELWMHNKAVEELKLIGEESNE